MNFASSLLRTLRPERKHIKKTTDQPMNENMNNCQVVVLGVGDNGTTYIENRMINYEDVSVVFARQGVAYIATDKSVYSLDCGPYQKSMLGNGPNKSTGPKVPCKCDFSQFPEASIFHIAAGYVCAFFLCRSGNIYCCGSNSSSCMGVEREESFSTDTPILFDRKVFNYQKCAYIACAAYTTCFAIENSQGYHDLYACGSDQFGECATGSIPTQSYNVKHPKLMQVSSSWKGQRVKKITCGDHGFIYLTQSGRVFVNGYNDSNQLCVEDHNGSHVCTVTEIGTKFGPYISVGSRFYAHCLLNSKNEIFGSSRMHLDAQNSEITSTEVSKGLYKYTFSPLKNIDLVELELGNSALFILTSDSRIFDANKMQFVPSWPSSGIKQLKASLGSTLHVIYLGTTYDQFNRCFPRLFSNLVGEKLTDVQFHFQ